MRVLLQNGFSFQDEWARKILRYLQREVIKTKDAEIQTEEKPVETSSTQTIIMMSSTACQCDVVRYDTAACQTAQIDNVSASSQTETSIIRDCDQKSPNVKALVAHFERLKTC